MLTLTLVAIAAVWLTVMAVVVAMCLSAVAGDRALERTAPESRRWGGRAARPPEAPSAGLPGHRRAERRRRSAAAGDEGRVLRQRRHAGAGSGEQMAEGELARFDGDRKAAAAQLARDLGLVVVHVLAVRQSARDEHGALADLERRQRGADAGVRDEHVRLLDGARELALGESVMTGDAEVADVGVARLPEHVRVGRQDLQQAPDEPFEAVVLECAERHDDLADA